MTTEVTREVPTSTRSAQIRAQLAHPVIDIDGHCMESLAALAPYLEEEGVDPGSPSLRRLLPPTFGPDRVWSTLSAAERQEHRVARPPWWGAPAANTRDLATALWPALLRARLDELGIDFSVVYPSQGLVFLHLPDDAERVGTCRALNRFHADVFADLSDRLAPVAAIPMHTPDEAIAALEHAVGELGFKAVLLAGYVQRPVAEVAEQAPHLSAYAQWLDFYGLDSAFDYDPVWEACRRLKVGVSFHSGSIGWGSRSSPSSYMYNHLGHLAEGHHALAKALILGGVPQRFPDVPFAFLEGGVAWASVLLADLVGHWEKRNIDALKHLDPANIDRPLLGQLQKEFGTPPRPPGSTRGGGVGRVRPGEDPALLDEFAACGFTGEHDIAELFARNLFFGCEADDPLTTTAFNTKVNVGGVRLQPMFGSDVAHWDVPDMTEVVEEAWELVEHELITVDDFRDFAFANPIRFFTRLNPDFFAGTTVADAVGSFLAEA